MALAIQRDRLDDPVADAPRVDDDVRDTLDRVRAIPGDDRGADPVGRVDVVDRDEHAVGVLVIRNGPQVRDLDLERAGHPRFVPGRVHQRSRVAEPAHRLLGQRLGGALLVDPAVVAVQRGLRHERPVAVESEVLPARVDHVEGGRPVGGHVVVRHARVAARLQVRGRQRGAGRLRVDRHAQRRRHRRLVPRRVHRCGGIVIRPVGLLPKRVGRARLVQPADPCGPVIEPEVHVGRQNLEGGRAVVGDVVIVEHAAVAGGV